MSNSPPEDHDQPDQVELDRLQRISAAAEAFSFWPSTGTEVTPEINLSAWRLMRLASGAMHLVGTNDTEGGTGRVSSRIYELSESQRTASTSSGLSPTRRDR